MKTELVLLCSIFIGIPAMAVAQPHAHRPHQCEAPVRPIDDQNDVLWQRFLAEIERFQACVNTEMAWHQDAARDHQAKARAVVELWNQFVTGSLNAPEDFPWPPED